MRWLIVALVMLAGAARAQDDPMAQQRCVWRCLAASPGNESPEYHQCVARECSVPPQGDGGAQAQTASPAAPAGDAIAQANQKKVRKGKKGKRLEDWTHALATDGERYFAGAEAKQPGRSFYYICTETGQSYYAIFGLTIAGAELSLMIDTVEYVIPFDWVDGEYRVSLPPGDTFMQALRAEARKRLRIRDAAGENLVTVTLRGSTEAIDAAVAACAG
ncbi:hypothetical protein R5H30_07220 [Sulfitobacter sp. D35]|uniref:hypothetical protein n=1 Tax=Sulfitobacter sp. D35 TaxID=3083252 RepID=UPI00296E727C|nr:hypothetical protein [Sulfitobacter sp. D35]MDW4497765.1 hypothetical protein [Sulfitobacter sp. D35]